MRDLPEPSGPEFSRACDSFHSGAAAARSEMEAPVSSFPHVKIEQCHCCAQ